MKDFTIENVACFDHTEFGGEECQCSERTFEDAMNDYDYAETIDEENACLEEAYKLFVDLEDGITLFDILTYDDDFAVKVFTKMILACEEQEEIDDLRDMYKEYISDHAELLVPIFNRESEIEALYSEDPDDSDEEMTFYDAMEIFEDINIASDEGDEEWDDAFENALTLVTNVDDALSLYHLTPSNHKAEGKVLAKMISLVKSRDEVDDIKANCRHALSFHSLKSALQQKEDQIFC